MVKLEDVIEAIKPRLSRVLLVAESSLPESQFAAFRKLVLDELGNSGLCRDLARLFGNAPPDRQGTGRHIHAGKEVDHE